jgi:hypothetical protein
MTLRNPVRKRALALALDHRLENIWLFLWLVHFLIAMPEVLVLS